MNQFKSCKNTVGVIIAVALIISFAGIVAIPGSVSAHAASANAAYNIDIHNILPIRPYSQNKQKLSITALGSFVPPCVTSAVVPRCYSPQQIRTAYNIQPLLNAGIRGAGQTVVLIDFATSPTLLNDVHLYDQIFGLNDPKINVISPFSTPSVDPGYYGLVNK